MRIPGAFFRRLASEEMAASLFPPGWGRRFSAQTAASPDLLTVRVGFGGFIYRPIGATVQRARLFVRQHPPAVVESGPPPNQSQDWK
jgi:hypothetical protein